jgi:hypothetical protein
MSASKAFADVQRMLTDCAPGHTIRLTNHFRMVKYRGKVFPTLPKHPTIELGHIRKMVRHFEIQECAAKYGMV